MTTQKLVGNNANESNVNSNHIRRYHERIWLIDSVIKGKNTDSVIKGRNTSQNDTFLGITFFPVCMHIAQSTHVVAMLTSPCISRPPRARRPTGRLAVHVVLANY